MLECFALQSCTENWKNSSIEKLEVRGSSVKCFIRKVVTRGDHSVTVGVLQTYVYVDQKSDPKRLVWVIMRVMIRRLWLELVSDHSLSEIV